VNFDVLFGYFTESLDSLNEGPGDFNLGIVNSIVWACAVDAALSARLGPSYSAARDADPNGRVLDGLRLARNAILHGQTFALNDGTPYPTDFPLFSGPPVWKSYEQLTEDWSPRNKGPGLERLRAKYEQEVAGRDIGAPLWDAREWLDSVAANGWTGDD
jgi:hypothetical protein